MTKKLIPEWAQQYTKPPIKLEFKPIVSCTSYYEAPYTISFYFDRQFGCWLLDKSQNCNFIEGEGLEEE